MDLGEELEYSILYNIIHIDYPNAYKIKGKCTEYDLWIPELESGIEIKYDFEARKTNNLFFEFEHNNKASGIKATDSDIWIHYDGTWLFFFKTNELKRMIEENNPYITENRHDRNSNVLTKGYLIDKEICEKYTYRLIEYNLL